MKDFEVFDVVVKRNEKKIILFFYIRVSVAGANSTHLTIPIYMKEKLFHDLWQYI